MKKTVALCLAMTILFGYMPGLFDLEAQAAEIKPIIITFKDAPAGDNRVASVIRGAPIKVVAENTQNMGLKGEAEDPMLIVKPTESALPKNPYFTLVGDKDKWDITPILKNKLGLPDTDPAKAAVGSYNLTTNYIMFQSIANSFQTEGDGGAAAGTFVLQQANPEYWLPVQVTSKVKLKYSTVTQKWTLEGTGDAATAGVFAGWKTEVGSGGHQQGSPTVKEHFMLTCYEANGNLREFKFEPSIYWEDVIPDPTDPTGTATIRIPKYNMNTAVDNSFDITFNYTSSNQLVLQVQDPRKVLEEIVKEATNNNTVANNFVKLTGTTDQYNYITEKVVLTTVANKFGQKINLKWEWVPETPNERTEKVMKLTYLNQTTSQMLINAMEEDTKGVLRVTAKYDYEDLNADAVFGIAPGQAEVSADLAVNVHGLGKPAWPEKVTKTIGGVNGGTETKVIETYGEGKDIPSAIYNMDVYKNGVNGFTPTENPYKLEFEFFAGRDNGLSRRLIIDAEGAKDAVSVTIKAGGADMPYKFGDNFDNNNGSDTITVTVVALKKIPENLNLKFRFFVAGINNSLREEPLAQEKANISIGDTSPDTTAELESLIMIDQKTKEPVPDFVFDPKKYEYTSPIIEIPNEMAIIQIKPDSYATTQAVMGYTVERMREDKLWTDVTGAGTGDDAMAPSPEQKWVADWGNQTAPKGHSITSGGGAARIIRLIPTVPMRITLKVRAQDPNIVKKYSIIVRRGMPSTDSSLKDLKIFNAADDTDHSDGFSPAFAPNVYRYDVTVPYHVEEVRAEFDTNHPKAKGDQIEPSISLISRLFGRGSNVPLAEDGTPTVIKIEVKSQSDLMDAEAWWDSGYVPSGDNSRIYELSVSRARPGTDATVTSLEVADKEDKPLTYTPAFNPDTEVVEYYELPVPYSVDKIKLTASTTDKYASMVVSGEGFTEIKLKSGKPSPLIPVLWYEDGQPHIITVTTTAEDLLTVKKYAIHLMRAAPSTDASLVSLDIKNQEGASLTEFSFNPETVDYQLSVPYEVKKVTFTPKATTPFVSSIKVDGRKVLDGQPSHLIELPESPNVKTVVVEVIAEDGTTKIEYRIAISRQKPSDDARLVSLSATAVDKLSPVFAPRTTNYTATVLVDAPGVTVTGVTNSPFATMTINGKKAASGVASEQIAILDVTQAVQIVVTAQDGKTKMTYRITFTNPNLVPKSSNADLARLKVNYGEMKPGFKPSVTKYEIYAKEDEYSVDIMPRAADKGAEVKVFAGSKEIGDERGNYSQSIEDGENEFVVKVTSSDKTKTKEYQMFIYRNEEDKQGSLKPITADDIDFENSGDVIIVDITKYARVAANVFTELKNYPEKTIIFEGNDYSLQFSAAELDKVIPSTAIYDFKMSFNSPIASEVYDEIDSYRKNRHADTVLIHFGYDGTLPGPCTLTMSLGKRYRSDTYYWHYYNEERGRLDYYGSFKTNSKGTFTVLLTHMSTYVFSDIKLYGSEDKSGGVIDIGDEAVIEKLNPDTGVFGGNR